MATDNQSLMVRAHILLGQVNCLDYKFEVRESHGGIVIRARYEEADTYTGEPAEQFTRKWIITPLMTDSEIVQTALKCCLTSMEHRTRESFKYKGRRIFGPHFDIEDLYALCKDRENAGGR